MKVLVVSADRSDSTGAARNLGDALLTDPLVGALRERGADARALDLGDARRAGGGPRVRAGGIRGMAAAVRGADAVVLGGGTLYADDQPRSVFAGLPRLCAATATLARAFGKRFATFGVGVDPVGRGRARAALRTTAAAGPVWVRDEPSVARLADMTGRTASLGADVSLLSGDEVGGHGRPHGERRGAALALNRAEAVHLTRDDVDALAERYGTVRVLSMHQGSDADAAAIPASLRSTLIGASGAPLTWQSAATAIGTSEVLVGSRMHAMYLAAMTHTPIAALAPLPKTRAFADEFGVPVVTAVRDAAQRSARVSPSALHRAEDRGRRAFEELTAWLGC